MRAAGMRLANTLQNQTKKIFCEQKCWLHFKWTWRKTISNSCRRLPNGAFKFSTRVPMKYKVLMQQSQIRAVVPNLYDPETPIFSLLESTNFCTIRMKSWFDTCHFAILHSTFSQKENRLHFQKKPSQWVSHIFGWANLGLALQA